MRLGKISHGGLDPIGTKIRSALLAFTLALGNFLCAHTELLAETTRPKQPHAPKAGQIVLQTSPNAQVYLNDVFKGQASEDDRLVNENPKSAEHKLRVSLPGKKDFQRRIVVVAGKEVKIVATLVEQRGAAEPRPTRAQGPAPGQARENPRDGLKYVWIPPGTFMMGCSPGDNECEADEKPAHQVAITKGFWVGQTEVTVAAYSRFVESTGTQMPAAPNFNADWNDQDTPIVNVSWDDATAFCGGAGGRLPTEAEWEYAARGGSTEARYGPLDEVAWYTYNSGQKTNNVGQKRANAFGLYDMLGNVWEWVHDWYDEKYYQSGPSQDPAGPASGQMHVLRGGSWYVSPRDVRVSYRNWFGPGSRLGNDVGFRCAVHSLSSGPVFIARELPGFAFSLLVTFSLFRSY